ncbi:MAG: enoyl-CoA hydratase [Gammaproteobacteria bacterium]
MSDSILLRNDGGGIRTLTLNRPQSRNALSDALMRELHGALSDAAEDKSVRVIIINASGAVFCAGHDLREMAAKSGLEDYREVFALCSKMMLAITQNPKPVIAQVRGMATAAGCQLVAACDIAIADDSARFATPGVHIGLFCSTPMVALSRNVGRKTAMKMLLTGDPLTAEQAAAAGLINEVAPADALDDRCQSIAKAIAAKSMLTLATGKKAFYRQLEMPLEEAYQYAGEVMATNMTAADAQEGINAFLTKRPPVWQDK